MRCLRETHTLHTSASLLQTLGTGSPCQQAETQLPREEFFTSGHGNPRGGLALANILCHRQHLLPSTRTWSHACRRHAGECQRRGGRGFSCAPGPFAPIVPSIE